VFSLLHAYEKTRLVDWKSYAIGVLLTTTVMFGTGATSPSDKWIHLAFPSPDNDEFGNKEFANKINQLGKDGWQLVDVESSMKDGTTSKRIYFLSARIES